MRDVLFQHKVKVGATEAERAHTSTAGSVGWSRPRFQLGIHVQRRVREINVRARMLAVDARREDFIAQCQRGLQQPGRTGSPFEMADVRLDRAQSHRVRRKMVIAEQVGHALCFHHIAHTSRSSVAFDQSRGGRRQACILPGSFQTEFLADRVRRGDPLAFAIAGRTDAAEHGIDLISVALGIGQAFHHKDRRALTHDEAVGALGIGARASGRQRADLAELDIGLDTHVAVNAAGDDRVEIVRYQSFRGGADCRHGGGAGRIADKVRTVEVVDVRDPAGYAVGQLARHAVFGDFGQVLADSVVQLARNIIPDRFRQSRKAGDLSQFVRIFRKLYAQRGEVMLLTRHGIA